MKNSENTYWGKSTWTAHDLDKKRLDCAIKTPTQSLRGVGEICAKERPGGEIYVELRYNDSMSTDAARLSIINIPPQFFDRIERHEDTSLADFRLIE